MEEWPKAYGPYELLKPVGSGGTGEVFLARPIDPSSGDVPSPVVVKRLHPQLSEDDEFVRRFHHEAELASAIRSKHLARVYDAGRVDDTFYIAMEYLPGWPVSRVMKDMREDGRQPSLQSACEIVAGALRGLAALHQARHPATQASLGIVHRDIAPKNILVGEDGVTRLIDLGLGKSTLQDWRTTTGIVMGSPGYMSPEQVTGHRIDFRSDLYSMGIVLWELLTLRRFIERGPLPAMLRAQAKPVWAPVSQLRAGVPPALDAVLTRALAPTPAARFEDADAFRVALLQAVGADAASSLNASTLVGELLWGELDRAKTEVTQLMRQAEQREDQPDPTVSNPTPHGPSPAYTPTPSRGQPLLTPTPTPRSGAGRALGPARRGGVPWLVVLGLVFGAASVGIGVGAVLIGPAARVEEAPLVVEPPAPTPVPEAAPGVTARAPASGEAPAAEPPPPPAPPPRRARRPAADPEPRDAPPPTATALLRRTRAVLGGLPKGSPLEDRAKDLMARLAAEAQSPMAGRLATLAREVRQLERRASR